MNFDTKTGKYTTTKSEMKIAKKSLKSLIETTEYYMDKLIYTYIDNTFKNLILYKYKPEMFQIDDISEYLKICASDITEPFMGDKRYFARVINNNQSTICSIYERNICNLQYIFKFTIEDNDENYIGSDFEIKNMKSVFDIISYVSQFIQTVDKNKHK